MTLYKNSAQANLATGTDVTTGNMPNPDQWSVVVPGAGGTIKSVDEVTAPGTEAIEVVPAAATQGYFGWTSMVGPTNQAASRFLWKCPTLPATAQSQMLFANASASSILARVQLNAAGQIVYLSEVDALVTAATTISGGVVPGTWYDISAQLTNGTTTTGTMTVTVRNLAGSILTGGQISASAANFGTSAIGTVRFGKVGTTGNSAATRWKYLSAQTGSASELPQPGANTAPTVAAIARQIKAAGQTASFTAVPADVDGTIIGHAWTVDRIPVGAATVTLSGSATATVTTSTLTTPGAYRLKYIATDDQGSQSAPVFAYAFIPYASGSPAVAYEVVANPGGFTAGGTAASVEDAISANTSAKYILTPSNPSGASITVALEVPATGHYVESYFFDWTADGTTSQAGVNGTITDQVFMGTTPISGVQTHSNTTGAPVQYTYSFTTGEDATLTDLKDIRLVLTINQT